ncbi:hypothetical protein IAR50_000517 [Cryptococcus sp. DSM 104548]
MYPAGPTAFYNTYSSRPSSRAGSPAPRSPGGVVQPPFDFPSVSFPPRLKNIGRQLSQISNDFFSEDEGENMAARREAIKKQESGGPAPARPQTPVQKGFKVENVPGMGEDPVMCPFCEKPLPPALFLEHTHQSESKATSKSAKAKEKQPDAPMPKTPKMSSDDLATTVKEGDIANHGFAEELVSADDLRRWASLAGITLSESTIPKPATTVTPKKASPGPTKPAESKAFPLLPPPPPPLQAGSGKPPPSRQDSGSGRFGFWKSSKKDEDEESSDDEGGAVGYQKIGAGDEESDDEEKKVSEVKSDEGKVKTQESVGVKDFVQDAPVEAPEKVEPVEPDSKVETVAPQMEASSTSNEDLKVVLAEVLAKVGQMSQSQNALLTSHSSLLTSLKIARSNLAMAEANTEMLEAQLARGPTPVVPINQRTVSSPVASTRPSRPASAVGDKQGPSNLKLTAEDLINASKSAPTNGEKSSWFSGRKKLAGNLHLPSAVSIVDSFSSPTAEFASNGRQSGEYFGGNAVPYGAAMPTERPMASRTQSHSGVSQSLGGTSTITRPAQASDIIQLRQAYSAAIAQISALTTEVADLKSGKKEMEEELESLSQELFEEANKMVADERKKRAEAEENLKEVREEKDALKETVKVLGGRVDSPAPDVQEQAQAEPASGSADVEPRDLDKHYAALRNVIHHVSSPPTSPPATEPSFPDILHQPLPMLHSTKEHAVVPNVPEEGRSTATPPIDIPSSRPLSVPMPTESNPWASSLGSNEGEEGKPEFKMSLMTPSPQPEENAEEGAKEALELNDE